MNTPTTLAAYAAALAVVFGAAVGVGAAVGPVGAAESSADGTGSRTPAESHAVEDHATGGTAEDAAPAPGGLAVSENGYTLELERAPELAGRSSPLWFRITGPDGRPLQEYETEHERDLHLVLLRRDGTLFQHLHPTLDAAGRWSTPLTLPAAGTYKLFADFTPAGAEQALTLATDVTVAGTVQPAALPDEQRTATVDGYTVELTGDLAAGGSSPLTLTVTKDGRPVTDLQPYLGAYGHLVALREGDLAYLHVHPEGEEPDGATGGPDIEFVAEVPSAGRYRLFLDFQHAGVVRTAEFRVSTETAGPDSPRATPSTAAGAEPDDGHDH